MIRKVSVMLLGIVLTCFELFCLTCLLFYFVILFLFYFLNILSTSNISCCAYSCPQGTSTTDIVISYDFNIDFLALLQYMS
jgi:hypothetical protein